MQVIDVNVSEVALVTRGLVDFVREDLFEGFHCAHVTSGVEVFVRRLGERVEFGDVFPRKAVGFGAKENVRVEFLKGGFHFIGIGRREDNSIVSVGKTEDVRIVKSGKEFLNGIELVQERIPGFVLPEVDYVFGVDVLELLWVSGVSD